MIDSDFITNTLVDLVRINSVNPDLEKGGAGEVEIGTYLHNTLSLLGFSSTVDTITEGRVNVIGKYPGTRNGKSLILNAHMDTVGVQGMKNPFGAIIKEGKLFGRGAYDMKGSIAAILGVAKAISEGHVNLSGDLILAFVADEEYESIGTSKLIKEISADACIVTEPTDLRVCLGHRGFGVYEITTHGKVAHGGLHKEGIDANIKMGKVLYQLDQLSKEITASRKHKLCGEASLHVPLIKGGQSLFIYSDRCIIQVERRTLPGEMETTVFEELKGILDKLNKEDKDFKATIKQVIWRNPHEISKDAAIVKSLSKSILPPNHLEYIGHTWWEDSGLFAEAGIPTVIVGPKGGGIHQQEEWVEIDSVFDLSKILLQTAINFCQ
ncbi:MAG: ArgE/DapE family deacylase [Cyclobacteriaceae bacterium]|nr:ArgE/DapE family deacylase [Cyclobacteriaceae bacterium]